MVSKWVCCMDSAYVHLWHLGSTFCGLRGAGTEPGQRAAGAVGQAHVVSWCWGGIWTLCLMVWLHSTNQPSLPWGFLDARWFPPKTHCIKHSGKTHPCPLKHSFFLGLSNNCQVSYLGELPCTYQEVKWIVTFTFILLFKSFVNWILKQLEDHLNSIQSSINDFMKTYKRG